MPLQTIFNLPTEKQDKIISAAKNEFTEKSFYDASINKIIKEAGISRGSFYMYFENKEDLFIHLMDDYRDNMIQNVISNIDEKECDMFNIALALFDYITDVNMNDEAKCFLSKTFTTIDSELLSNFINIKDDKKEIKMLKKYANVEKFNIVDDKELIYIGDLMIGIMAMEIMFVFSGRYSAVEGRKRIKRKFELIKYGILK